MTEFNFLLCFVRSDVKLNFVTWSVWMIPCLALVCVNLYIYFSFNYMSFFFFLNTNIFVCVSPSGPCYSAEKNCCLSQSVCCAHSPVPQQIFHSLWRGLHSSTYLFPYSNSLMLFCLVDTYNLSNTLILSWPVNFISWQKLANISLRIQQIETTLCILEAKVSPTILFTANSSLHTYHTHALIMF